MFGRLK